MARPFVAENWRHVMRTLSSAYGSHSSRELMASWTAKGWSLDVVCVDHFCFLPTLTSDGQRRRPFPSSVNHFSTAASESTTRAADTVTFSLTTDGPTTGATLKTLLRLAPLKAMFALNSLKLQSQALGK